MTQGGTQTCDLANGLTCSKAELLDISWHVCVCVCVLGVGGGEVQSLMI